MQRWKPFILRRRHHAASSMVLARTLLNSTDVGRSPYRDQLRCEQILHDGRPLRACRHPATQKVAMSTGTVPSRSESSTVELPEVGGALEDTIVGYASARWTRIVEAVLRSATDVRTLDAWAHEAAVSESVIRVWCKTAGLSPKLTLDFARLLRIVVRGEGSPAQPFEVLDVTDERTMRRLLATGGITLTSTDHWPSVCDYLRHQMFIRRSVLLRQIAMLCEMLTAELRATRNATQADGR
jgi:hypothetical protein